MFKKFEYKSLRLLALGAFALVVVLFNVAFTTNISAQIESGSISSEAIIQAHNKIRQEYNLEELTPNAFLSISAQEKAKEMLRLNCWDHYCPPNTPPWDFITDANYTYLQAGENLAEGFYDVDDVMTAWMNSPTHKENIIRGVYKDIGVGIVSGDFQGIQDNIIIVVHFGNSLEDFSNALLIQNPQDGAIVSTGNVFIEGVTASNDTLQLFLNDEFNKSISANEGLFFTSINIEATGEYNLLVQDLGNTARDSVNFEVQSSLNSSDNISLSSISPSTKSSINIVFLSLMFMFFIIDLALLKFSTLDTNGEIRQNKHHSSYHLGIILVLIIIIATGSLAGSVGPQAIFVNL